MKSYIKLEELTVTDTGLYNHSESHEVAANLDSLRHVLNVIRHLIGCPLIVNSGYRSKAVNDKVGGSPNSLHLSGRAADIRCSRPASLRSVCAEFKKKGIFVECIDYGTYIHVAI